MQVSKTTEKHENMLFPQTMTTFRCSNQECQDEKDKQTEKRLKLIRDKEASDKIRLEKKERLKLEN
jgi:hypothetical protein